MKLRNLAIIACALSLAAIANAQPITSFENLDFDAGVQNFPSGFDNPAADVPGWRDHTAMTDSGTEGPGAWWGTYEDFSAFMAGGNGAYNLSDHTIQSGDLFAVEFYAKSWPWTSDGIGQWTVSLFYDDPANTFGSYTTPELGDNESWVYYSTTSPIAATEASVGGKLGVIFLSSGGDISQVDEIVISIVPEPSSISLLAMAGLGMLLRRRLVK